MLPTLSFLPLGPIARILALVSKMLRPRLDSLHRSLHRNAPLNDQVGQQRPIDGSSLGNKREQNKQGDIGYQGREFTWYRLWSRWQRFHYIQARPFSRSDYHLRDMNELKIFLFDIFKVEKRIGCTKFKHLEGYQINDSYMPGDSICWTALPYIRGSKYPSRVSLAALPQSPGHGDAEAEQYRQIYS